MIFCGFIMGSHKFNNLLGRGLEVVRIFMLFFEQYNKLFIIDENDIYCIEYLLDFRTVLYTINGTERKNLLQQLANQ